MTNMSNTPLAEIKLQLATAMSLLQSAITNIPTRRRDLEELIEELQSATTLTRTVLLVMRQPEKPEASHTLVPAEKRQRVAYIVGHTAEAKGAYSPFMAISEYDYWKQVANIIAGTAVSFDTTVILRDKIGISGAYAAAAKAKADLIIELHFNAHTGSAASGLEVLYGTSRPLSVELKSNAAAKAYVATMRKLQPSLPIRQNGTGLLQVPLTGRGGINVNTGDIPSVLIEPFFGTNSDDCKLFASKTSSAHMLIAATAAMLEAIEG